MDNIRRRLQTLWPSEQAYEPVDESDTDADGRADSTSKSSGFSRVEYSIFLLLGVSMLWAWNMFLAAGPYFQQRFRKNQWMYDNFQAAEISVSTIANLGTMLILTRMQANASYPKRIITSLIINVVVFSLLAISTAVDIGAEAYFAFLMCMMFFASVATGFCQNGVFAYVSGYAQPSYTQGIMTGQAVAGVLPCIAQIVSVLALREDAQLPSDDLSPNPPPVSWTAALAYFLTATAISVVTFFVFSILLARNRAAKKMANNNASDDAGIGSDHKSIPLLYLFKKLIWLASGVFITFAVTMAFPVLTQRIFSVKTSREQADAPIFQPASFIPLALLFWNAGDLVGRMITAVPTLSLVPWPRIVFGLATVRIAWIGLYYLCNIQGQGAVVPSDFFYLVVVQLFFGISNGYIGSTCMIGATEWVDEEEREAAGGFMGLCLVGGLSVGSLLSFLVAG